MDSTLLVDFFGPESEIRVGLECYDLNSFAAQEAGAMLLPLDKRDSEGNPTPDSLPVVQALCAEWANNCALSGDATWVPFVIEATSTTCVILGIAKTGSSKRAILPFYGGIIEHDGEGWTWGELRLVQNALKTILQKRVESFQCKIVTVYKVVA